MVNKKSVTITITDLDDKEKVYEAIGNLFRTILTYYATKEDFKILDDFVLSIANYVGIIMKLLGFTEEDFKE